MLRVFKKIYNNRIYYESINIGKKLFDNYNRNKLIIIMIIISNKLQICDSNRTKYR
jgi:hypothetical protein